MNKRTLCAFFGENPSELEFGYDEDYYICAAMKYRLVKAIEGLLSEGCSSFISTVDEGAAMWGAEACAAIKQLGGNIELIAAPTSENQTDRWHPERRERYFGILECADSIVEPYGELYGEDYILKHADVIMILGSTEHPRLKCLFETARTLGKTVLTV